MRLHFFLAPENVPTEGQIIKPGEETEMQHVYEETQELLKSIMEQFAFKFEEETQVTEGRNLESPTRVCEHLVRHKTSWSWN